MMTDQQNGNPPVLPWTDERVDLLRKLWLEGLSASRIAAELRGGVTRNAVIGKVHRLGLSGRIKAPNTAVPRPKISRPTGTPVRPGSAVTQRAAALQVQGNVAFQMQERPIAAPVARRHYEDNVVPMTDNVTIMELRESMCRWPVGDPSSPDFRYCGGKAPIGEGPYCACHSRMAYQPTQDRRQRKIA